VFRISGGVAGNCTGWLSGSILIGRHLIGDFTDFSPTDDPGFSAVLAFDAAFSVMEEFCL
jgi:hypothetical protein